MILVKAARDTGQPEVGVVGRLLYDNGRVTGQMRAYENGQMHMTM